MHINTRREYLRCMIPEWKIYGYNFSFNTTKMPLQRKLTTHYGDNCLASFHAYSTRDSQKLKHLARLKPALGSSLSVKIIRVELLTLHILAILVSPLSPR